MCLHLWEPAVEPSHWIQQQVIYLICVYWAYFFTDFKWSIKGVVLAFQNNYYRYSVFSLLQHLWLTWDGRYRIFEFPRFINIHSKSICSKTLQICALWVHKECLLAIPLVIKATEWKFLLGYIYVHVYFGLNTLYIWILE